LPIGRRRPVPRIAAPSRQNDAHPRRLRPARPRFPPAPSRHGKPALPAPSAAASL
jgi:hypothetical protein